MKYTCIESEYLVALLKCALKNEDVPDVPVGLNWEKLVKLSNEQQVYSTIAPVINKINIPVEQAQELTFYTQNELVRMIAMKNELEQIEKELEDKQIKHIYLKGLELRNYYPKTSMRQMSDYDILYDESRRSDIIKIMKKRGFELVNFEGYGDDFVKKPYYTFEFHRALFGEQDEFNPDFNPWDNAIEIPKSSRLRLTREDNYLYILLHLYKHFYCRESCGIRFYCDIYLLLRSNDKLDFDYINEKLKSYGVFEFNNTVVKFVNALFDGASCDEEEQKLLDTVFKNGIYGKADDKIKQRMELAGGSKFKYLFRRIFPPKSEMVKNYNILKKHIVLLPFMYIYRLVYKSIKKSDVAKKEIKELKKY